MNSHISKKENDKFCLHNLPNRNGKYIRDFSLESSLSCPNTIFQKRRRKLWIYTYPNNAKVQLDDIHKPRVDSALICEAYSSFIGVSQNCLDKDMSESKEKL